MNRTPPIDVRRQLRREVGFGCPIEGCSNPYLTWHHFDPSWNERPHHDQNGMVALCAEHHTKADSGAFTSDQIRQFKRKGLEGGREVQGRFDWLRRDLLTVVGGNFYPAAATILSVKGHPVISFSRDDERYLRINIDLPFLSKSGQDRLVLSNSDWLLRGNPSDFECPPSGKLIHARYDGGDELRVEFFELADEKAFIKRYPKADPALSMGSAISFPSTAVEVALEIPGTPFSFGPNFTKIGTSRFIRCIMEGETAFSWDAPW